MRGLGGEASGRSTATTPTPLPQSISMRAARARPRRRDANARLEEAASGSPGMRPKELTLAAVRGRGVGRPFPGRRRRRGATSSRRIPGSAFPRCPCTLQNHNSSILFDCAGDGPWLGGGGARQHWGRFAQRTTAAVKCSASIPLTIYNCDFRSFRDSS
jgi:hypothetical protein